jgi:hypothetical protein
MNSANLGKSGHAYIREVPKSPVQAGGKARLIRSNGCKICTVGFGRLDWVKKRIRQAVRLPGSEGATITSP